MKNVVLINGNNCAINRFSSEMSGRGLAGCDRH